jgi:spore germination protein YaaH
MANLTALVAALRTELGEKPLYVMAEAPAPKGSAYTGYDYTALSQSADRLILRITPLPEASGTLTVAPVDSLESVYHTLYTLIETIPPEKLSLLINTEGTAWRNGKQTQTLTGIEIAALLEDDRITPHYSSRYACAYLLGTDQSQTPEVTWYLNDQSMAERIRMLHLFGVNQLCLSNLSAASEELLSAMK